MVLTTPGIPGKLLEFQNILPGAWKTPVKTDNFPELLENSLTQLKGLVQKWHK